MLVKEVPCLIAWFQLCIMLGRYVFRRPDTLIMLFTAALEFLAKSLISVIGSLLFKFQGYYSCI